jgi:hypothetical protein
MLAHYTKLNFQRIKRIAKTLQLTREIEYLMSEIESEMLWIVIVEAWCGDVPQNLPYIHAISQLTEKISLLIILKDENPGMYIYLVYRWENYQKLTELRRSGKQGQLFINNMEHPQA